MMPLRALLRNKLLLQKHFNVNEISMDEWPYWLFEENIKIVNDINKEEEEKQKNSESTPKNNLNPNSYIKDMQNIANKFKK